MDTYLAARSVHLPSTSSSASHSPAVQLYVDPRWGNKSSDGIVHARRPTRLFRGKALQLNYYSLHRPLAIVPCSVLSVKFSSYSVVVA